MELLDQLLDAARAEVAAQQTLTDAEGAYRRAWWTTTLLLGHDIPHGEIARVTAAVAELLNCSQRTVAKRRYVALRVDPAVAADESIYRVRPTLISYFLSAAGVEAIGPREVVELQRVEAEDWSAREIEQRGAELRSRLGLPVTPSPQRATPRSQPTARLNGAQSIAFGQRVRLQEGPGVSLVRLADGALDIAVNYESSVDRFRLTAEGTVIVEAPP